MIAPPPLPAPPVGATPDWRHAFGGVWRLTWRRFAAPGQWAIGAALLGGLGLLTYAVVDRGSQAEFLDWASGVYLTSLVPIVAFLSGARLIREQMSPVAVDYVLTRPVARPAFVGFSCAGHFACLQVVLLAALAVVVGAGLARDVPGLAAALPALAFAQFAAVCAFAALGLLFGTFTPRYLVLGLAYAALIETGLGNAPIQLSRISLLHHVKSLLSGVGAEIPAALVPTSASVATTVLLGFTVAAVVVAAVRFATLEFAGQRPGEE